MVLSREVREGILGVYQAKTLFRGQEDRRSPSTGDRDRCILFKKVIVQIAESSGSQTFLYFGTS